MEEELGGDGPFLPNNRRIGRVAVLVRRTGVGFIIAIYLSEVVHLADESSCRWMVGVHVARSQWRATDRADEARHVVDGV